ncbi:MAG: helix-turn-helix domain-containing protein [Microbacterium sp.]|uniref:winged helix-turn-helix transcriptional regulator n=1 Tax=Microbacterium sp. TaxID=51671 RepID=UPI002715D638|nr:helix-turn-helix domain-containing protein [Microbacterium sp.]MDO8381682.1 helix-turn-helix domain-containing protein [Microbacterium sp.]
MTTIVNETPIVDLSTAPADYCTESTRILVRDMLVRVADKWTMFVIEQLAPGPMRFTTLMSCVPGISHRMLTQTLRALQRDGMVTRTAYAEVPPRVEYELTELGRTLIGRVAAFVAWAQDHHAEVTANRESFDAG